MSQAKSIAIWCKTSDGDFSLLNDKMQMHVNYWHFSHEKKSSFSKLIDMFKNDTRKKDKPDFLDVGLMIPLGGNLESVSIYLPFIASIDDIEDISPLLKNYEVAGAIFNENLKVNPAAQEEPHCFSLIQNNNELCRVRKFAHNSSNVIKDSDLISYEKIETGEGSTLTLKKEAFLAFKSPSSLAYYRFRITLKGDDKQVFLRGIEPKDKLFKSSYEKTEFIDFRINEFRLLPQLVQRKVVEEQEKTFLPMNRIDFLLAVNLVADITGARKEFHKSRFLEPLLWKNYFTGNNEYVSELISRGMLVYHWKKVRVKNIEERNNESFNDFVAFVKLKVNLTSTSTIVKYMLVAFLVGLCGSLIGSFLYSGPDGIAEAKNRWVSWWKVTELVCVIPLSDKIDQGNLKQRSDKSLTGLGIEKPTSLEATVSKLNKE